MNVRRTRATYHRLALVQVGLLLELLRRVVEFCQYHHLDKTNQISH